MNAPLAGMPMAVDPNAPKVARFVTLRGEPSLIRYNSRLPVVYIPEAQYFRAFIPARSVQ